MKYVRKTFLQGTFMCAPRFLVCARLMTCVYAHSLEGTLMLNFSEFKTISKLFKNKRN